MSSSFKTTSGLPDNFEQDIEEFWFGKNPSSEQATDQIYAIIRGKSVDLESGEEEAENTVYLSVGKDWEETKGGEAVKNKSGKGQFNKNSSFGRFIDHAVTAGGDGLLDLLQERGEAYEAETWKGLRFRMERKEFSFTRSGETEKQTYSVTLPVEYLGEVGEAPKKAPAKKAPAKRATPAKRPVVKKAAKEDDLRSALVAYAAEFEEDDFDTFVASVYDEETFPRAAELEDDEELANAVLDEDDIWAEAH